MNSDHGLREQLVRQLVSAGRIHTEPAAAAFRTVPRHLFLPGVEPEEAYVDEAIVTRWDSAGLPISSSSQPAIMAVMLEQLAVEPGQRVLEIGAGTGYNAALLAHLVGATGAVTTIDIDADLVEHARLHLSRASFPGVTVVCADGAAGCPENSPYDRIILTVGAWDLAPAWLDQLSDGGRLVLPLSLRGMQRSVAFERRHDHLASVSIIDCGFMPLRGALAAPDPARRLGEKTGLFLKLGDERHIDAAALHAALGQPGDYVSTGVTVTPAEIMGGLGLWLALHDPDVGQLSALDTAADRDLVLIGENGLAALVRPDAGDAARFIVGARNYGPAADLAQRLAANVQEWDCHGRPSTAELRIRAYPRAHHPSGHATAMVIDKHHTRLLLDW